MDTGPLVAFLDRRDRFHAWATSQWAEIEPLLLTCEAVLAEACFLVRNLAGGATTVVNLLTRGAVKVAFRLDAEAAVVERFLSRYASVPMSLAGACLVQMAERQHGSPVMTVDQDFRLYRIHGRHVIPTVMPGNR